MFRNYQFILNLWLAIGGLAMLNACSSDYLPLSGGALEGEVQPSPTSWVAPGADKIIQLESNPAAPYSVNLWVIGTPTHLNVFAGDSRTNWVEHIEVDPRVRVKAGDSLYELTAQRVTDAAEFEQFAVAWKAKYGNRPRNENVAETYLYRLVPRS